ncbi:hypothetical protein FBZ93_12060 [Bradyrhizobium macuxiense]|uniref:Uncharacterized protein n=1 Tax=Bradyrhizobium macuxiense TaxID=1755647 RepID=A0A560KX44_9BRAD|nr:hypothetical protein FBZ93_12060 [Bradyrhizobium macuxiense]
MIKRNVPFCQVPFDAVRSWLERARAGLAPSSAAAVTRVVALGRAVGAAPGAIMNPQHRSLGLGGLPQ